LKAHSILSFFAQAPSTPQIEAQLAQKQPLHLHGLKGSSMAIVAANTILKTAGQHLFVLPDKESAAYFCNDLEHLLMQRDNDFTQKKVLFYPTSYRRPYEIEKTDNANVLLRSEVITKSGTAKRLAIVSYPEALIEKVVTRSFLSKNTFSLSVSEALDVDFLLEFLTDYQFERVDFVLEPGQFSIRGGIVDVFSFANDLPFRIELGGNTIESLRTFDPETQLSVNKYNHIHITPNTQNRDRNEKHISIFEYLGPNTVLWFSDLSYTIDKVEDEYKKSLDIFGQLESTINQLPPPELFLSEQEFIRNITSHPCVETSNNAFLDNSVKLEFNTLAQPSFNKNFELFYQTVADLIQQGFVITITSDNPKQLQRIESIITDMSTDKAEGKPVCNYLQLSIHDGFIDHDNRVALFTDHQIFDRYQRFSLRDGHQKSQAITLKEIYNLQPGDYITHVDHGVGRYDGLEKMEVNGKIQEAIRLVYKDNDLLYISIHSLHRITKYVGKDGAPPTLHRLGSGTWAKTKEKAKQRVKDIASELIQLYAKRRSSTGFAFTPDTYLQTELEASFMYEDTPDQIKATTDVKQDMERDYPMDRLVCGDVGFGKTEIAVRAAFKAVADNKQVAVLVPTTILAMQHYKTFADRLSDFPCTVDYINRFKSTKQQNETIHKLVEGKVDILIGTHRLLSKDIEFKDLGLLIIDEEQKFGVSAKEKLRHLRVNVDTLTLTATPIPRTLQFSMLGARDLSVINTPPPNRHPIQTEVHSFDERIIRDAILYEISRGGQVFFVHNRINNIAEIAGMIQRNIPDANIRIAHGQMEGPKLEAIMLDFIEGNFDVLVSTTIVESGLDIPNANTIIINEAQNYGLSDLHQLRGRVGRNNKKAFCYLLTPSKLVLTPEARRRLKALEDFSDLGSGFNIALRDLDIRGAGDLLGGEQSGFISDIGYEMYQRIIDEAIRELKSKEFKSLYAEQPADVLPADCLIDTDMELLIPDSYVSNISERLSLYKELDSIENDDQLANFSKKLTDMFGQIPESTRELILSIKLRKLARNIGFEKISLKNNKLVAHFISDPHSDYFSSETFAKVLNYVQNHPQTCKMKQQNDKLSITIANIPSIIEAIKVIEEVLVSL
jgi:transcription-repair coupling factor (superfamily II helicase)